VYSVENNDAMKRLIHIPRPNQNFHVGIGIYLAMLANEKSDDSIELIVCNDKLSFCPVKTMFDREMIYGSCPDCDEGHYLIENIVMAYNETAEKKIRIIYTGDYGDNALLALDREYIYEEFSLFKKCYGHWAEGDDLMFTAIEFPWLSELMSFKCLSAADIASQDGPDDLAVSLIELSIRSKRIAQRILENKSWRTYTTYNGRHTHSRSFWLTAKSLSPQSAYLIHEIGTYPDTFMLYDDNSPEATFEKLPQEVFPDIIPSQVCNNYDNFYQESISVDQKLEYFSPRLTSEIGFYKNKLPIAFTNTGSFAQSNRPKGIMILVSSVDEISAPYPVDRVKFEQDFLKIVINRINSNGIPVKIRLHPRSSTQLERSREQRGRYAAFVDFLHECARMNGKIEVFEPGNEISTYELVPQIEYALSVASIAALEVQALGIPSIVHSRARGSKYASGRIVSLVPEKAADQFFEWLEFIKKKDHIYLQKAKLAAQKYLLNDMKDMNYKIPGMVDFYPYRNNSWIKLIMEYARNRNHWEGEIDPRLLRKIMVT